MPIEIAARELDSRLLIALFAVRDGLDVVLGQKWLLQKNAPWMPKGFWIFKTLTPGDAKQMRRIKRAGHKIGAIDEEMPGLGESKHQLRWVDRDAVETAEVIFCLGNQHQLLLKNAYPHKASSMVVTGNPRWDLLRTEFRQPFFRDADKLKSNLGRIILINTNTGLINSAKNSFDGHIRAFARDGRIDLNLEEDRDYVNDRRAFESANLKAIVPLAKRLAAEFSDHTIVLRPHPNENIHYYNDAFADSARIKIIREGSVVSWLLASEVLIHTSCTTASEAYALGKPAISFETEPSPFHQYLLSGALSIVAKNEYDLIKSLNKILAGEKNENNESQRKQKFENFFASQSGRFAAEKIASCIADRINTSDNDSSVKWKRGIFFRKKWRPSAHQGRMFPSISSDELKARLSTLAAALEGMHLPQIEQIGDGQFRLHS